MVNCKQLAFTLAEILIVIGILGIVAEMTIPSLITSYQIQTSITQLQKAYNETSGILNQIASDSGCVGDLGCSGMFDIGTDNTSFGQAFVKYFKVAKDCGTSSKNCWPDQTNQNYDGSSATNTNFNTQGYYTFITADGMSFSLENKATASGCGGSTYCAFITIDINNLKGPNTYGRDTFLFITYLKPYSWIKRMLMAYGEQGTNPWNLAGANHCSPTEKTGWYCAGRIIEKGWVMDYLN